jgi:hypothetical protein
MFVTRVISMPALCASCARAIFIQPRHGEPTMARNLFRVVHGDQTVGVAWISDQQHAHIGGSVFIAAKAGFEMKNFANIAHGGAHLHNKRRLFG